MNTKLLKLSIICSYTYYKTPRYSSTS